MNSSDQPGSVIKRGSAMFQFVKSIKQGDTKCTVALSTKRGTSVAHRKIAVNESSVGSLGINTLRGNHG